MKLKVRRLVLLLALFALALTSAAQDEPPVESPEDNACYAGGSLEGKCDWPTDAEDEWAWTCGWYIARAENDIITQDGIPFWCNYYIGPPIVPVCFGAIEPGITDIALIAPLDMFGNGRAYGSEGGVCTGESDVVTIVYAPATLDGLDLAFEKCETLLSDPGAAAFPMGKIDEFWDAPETYWLCIPGSLLS